MAATVVVVDIVVVAVADVSGRNRALILRTQSKVFPIHTQSHIYVIVSSRAMSFSGLFLYDFCFFSVAQFAVLDIVVVST